MAEPDSESASTERSGSGARRVAIPIRTPEGKLHLDELSPPPPISDHDLIRCIGRGSFGEVWLARTVLGEYRAVKIIHRSHFDSDHAYEREFEALKRYEPVSRADRSQVAILHVARNNTLGFYYYVMELADDFESPQAKDRIESEPPDTGSGKMASRGKPGSWAQYVPHTLRQDLTHRGRLPIEECIPIGISLATALERLHGHGLIHRDIKPSNVIFVKGVPKLADIGLVARVDATLSFVGTEGYIPPEGPGTPQADLYSLGKVLYEISSGKDRLAFPEPLTQIGAEPQRLRLLELNAVIHKACHSDPRQRYESAAAMRSDLELLKEGSSVRKRHLVQRRQLIGGRLAVVIAVATALCLGGYWAYDRLLRPQEMVAASEDHPVAVPLKASVFVLPFRSMGSSTISDDLSSRFTDAFIDSLALIEGVRRSPRKSGWRYLDENEVRRALAETNQMRHILTGRLSASNEAARIDLVLYQRTTQQEVWRQSFQGKTNDLVALEARALQELVNRLGLKLSSREREGIGTLLTNNLEAWGWYQKAVAAYEVKAGTQSGYKEVRELAQQAMNLDRRFILADCFDAGMLRNLAQDRAPSDVWRDVKLRMESILAADDTFAWACDHLSGYKLVFERDWDGAYALWNAVLRYCARRDSWWLRAYYYRILGWMDQARHYQELSEQREPTSDNQRFCMAASRWCERRYGEGIKVARRTLEMYPGHAEGYQWLAHCLVANGDFLEGIDATYKAQKVWKKQEMTALRAVAYAKMGQTDKAREVLTELLEIQRSGPYLQPYFVARVYSALKDREKALDWLEKAEQDHSEYLVLGDFGGGLRTDHMWDEFLEEPRFKVLLEKVGLDQWPRPKPHTAKPQGSEKR